MLRKFFIATIIEIPLDAEEQPTDWRMDAELTKVVLPGGEVGEPLGFESFGIPNGLRGPELSAIH